MIQTVDYADILAISGVGTGLHSFYPHLLRENIAFVTGVFDLFHYGHIILLKEAKGWHEKFMLKGCDRLWVGVHTDEAVLFYKGKSPVMNLQERIRVLEHCDLIDVVIKIPAMRCFREEFYRYINWHIQSEDNDDYSIAKRLGKFRLIGRERPGISTTTIKERIRRLG